MDLPFVAVSADTRDFENYTWHAAPETYLKAAVETARVTPLVVPNFPGKVDYDALLSAVDGVLITGSKSNVHPELYGETPDASHEPFDPGRDNTSIPMIRAALDKGVPLLAICRGIQELNVALGGTLATEIQEQEGMHDHRAPVSDDQRVRFAIRHHVTVKEGSCLAGIVGAGDVHVNSLHRQAISKLAPGLAVDALAEDGTVEAVSVIGAKGFAVGVQWHPEYWAATDKASGAIFKAFGDAVRAHRDARRS